MTGRVLMRRNGTGRGSGARIVLALLLSMALTATATAVPLAVDAALPAYTSTASVAGQLRCSGADTMQDLVDTWSSAFRRHQPQATIHTNRDAKLSADGFAALLNGQVDMVTFVREPFASEIAAFVKKFGYPPMLINVAGGSYATKGGTHAIAIYVNADNPLARLTLAQVDAIFSSTLRRGASRAITTWGELGLGGDWSKRPLHVYGMLRQRGTGNPPGIVNYMKQRALLGGDWRHDLREQTDQVGETALDAIVNRVAADPDGIGYSGFAYKAPGAKTVALAEAESGPFYSGQPAEVASRDYPFSRKIYLAINAAPGKPLPPLVREFLRFVLSIEGQQAVALDRMQFIPLDARQAATPRAQLR